MEKMMELRTKFPNLRERIAVTMEYLWIVVLILNGNSVYNANALRDYHLLFWCVVATALLLGANLLLRKARPTKGAVILAAVLAVHGLIYIFMRHEQMTVKRFAYLFVFGLPCLVMTFSAMHRQKKLLPLFYRMVNVVCALGAVSIFFWVFGVLLGWIQPNMQTEIKWGHFTEIDGYFGIHFAFQQDTTFFKGQHLYRNSGIFAEAPMFNLWADLALATEMLLKEKPSKIKIAVLCVTIVTTLSTTGLIFIALCAMLLGLLHITKIRNLKKWCRWLLIGLLAVVAAVAGYALYRLMVVKIQTVSFLMRLSDYVGAVALWLKHPVFGSGFANLATLVGYVYSPNGTVGFSNSITGVLATGGLWMEMLYLIPHMGTMFPKITNSKRISAFAVCFFYLFFTTAFFARYIAVVMIAFGLVILMQKEGRNAKDQHNRSLLRRGKIFRKMSGFSDGADPC